MAVKFYVAGLVSFILAAVLTLLVRRVALARGIIDHPNSRSSHSTPTPRGGGLAIVSAASICILAEVFWGIIHINLALALVGGGLAVAWIGLMDDRGVVSVGFRLSIHIVAAVWAMYILGGLPPLQIESAFVDLGVVGNILGVVAIVWILNLFNFMDGIDGIASSEAVFVTMSGSLLGLIGGASNAVPAAGFAISGASLGFLVWNWPPAKIFMGDVGSGYLGYVIAVLALSAAHDTPSALYVWLILGGMFFVDATVTLIRRLLRRERVHDAHRSHAYQWMAQRWQSHKRVTVVLCAINVGWLLPLAWACAKYPTHALSILGIALLPLVVLVLIVGAGRTEAKDR